MLSSLEEIKIGVTWSVFKEIKAGLKKQKISVHSVTKRDVEQETTLYAGSQVGAYTAD